MSYRDFSCEGVGGNAASRFTAYVCGLCPQIRVCEFILDLLVMSIVLWKNGKSENAWSSPSIVDGERVSVAKQSHASADGLATAQQAGDFAANMGGLCHQLCEFVCSCWSCIQFQLFFARVLSAHTRKLRDPPSIIDRDPQERVSPRNGLHCYIGKMRWEEQRSRSVVLALWKLCFQINPLAQSTFSFNSCCLDFFLPWRDA